MSLKSEWKTAKTKFEAATKKKKPSETFLGIFRKSSGLESALDKVDKALAKALASKDKAEWVKNVAVTDKAVKEYVVVKERYYETMKKGAKDEDQNYQQELMILYAELESYEAFPTSEMYKHATKKGW